MVSTAAFHARVRGSVPGLGGLKETKLFLPHPRVKVSIVGSLRDREVACSASDRQGSNFESCVWRTVSSQSSHHPQEVLLAQFSLYVHKGGLKPDSFFHLSTSALLFINDHGPSLGAFSAGEGVKAGAATLSAIILRERHFFGMAVISIINCFRFPWQCRWEKIRGLGVLLRIYQLPSVQCCFNLDDIE